ncbi:MAG TPA: TIR domain-containing protein [Pyrinomonadaceae bacterium]|nr:TIR domain-containing protein [Pyrinomonadaceae bacterium]
MNKQPLLIPDAYDFGPLPPKPRETPWEKFYRFFFGDDVFISYARSDAIRYVPSLAAHLAAKKHICFFDQLVADPNEDLPEKLKKKILRSTVFVLVGTKGAVASSFVRKEIELFRHTRRPFIPVDVDGALAEQENWHEVIGVAKIQEQGARVRGGDPSPEVINLIKDSFRYKRRSQWLRASLLAGVSATFITIAVSLLVIRAARAEAATIQRQADAEVAAANKKVGEAEQRLQSITVEAGQAKADAEAALNQVQDADAAAEVAVTQKRAAEQSMRRAQELERQSAERAADTSRREAGSRAGLLAREPGMEPDALALAVEAAEQSVAHGGYLPDEVTSGVVAAAEAADYSLPLEDVGTRDTIFPLISPNGEKILGRIFDLRNDSTRLVFWDGRTGKSSLPAIEVARSVLSPSFSRDGKRLVALILNWKTQQKALFLLDLTGPQARPVETLCGAASTALDVALDSDGSHILISEQHSQDNKLTRITLCEIGTGRKEVLADSPVSNGHGVAFTPEDEPTMYGQPPEPGVGEVPPAIYLLRSGRKIMLKHYGSPAGASFEGFGDDGSTIIISKFEDATGFSRRWQERVYIQSGGGDLLRLGGYRGTIESAAFVDGRARVVTVSGSRVRVADARSSPNFAALRAHVRPLDVVAFSPDNRTVLTVGDDGKGRLWDIRTGRLRHTLAITDESLSESSLVFPRSKHAAFGADGKRIVIAISKDIQTWDVETGRAICHVPVRGAGDEDYPLSVSFLAGGDYVLAAYRTGPIFSNFPDVRVFISFLDARTCTPVGTFNFGEEITSLSFSQDGTAVITGAYPKGYTWERPEMKLWSLGGVDLRNGVQIQLPSSKIARPPGHLKSFLLDATRMLTVTEDDTGQLWVSGNGSHVHLKGWRGGKQGMVRAALAANGTRAVALSGKEVRVWDARSGEFIVSFECDVEVGSLTYPFSLSPDGFKLVIAASNNTVRVYPTSREGFLRAAKRLAGR